MANVPKMTAGDVAHSLAKGLLGAIPYAGGAAAELFNLIIAPPLERRKTEFLNDISGRLKVLEQEDRLKISDLSSNDKFIDVLMTVLAKVLQTSDQNKIRAFQNVILNTALGEAPEKSQAMIYLNILNDFTDWHLKILVLVNNPTKWHAKNNRTPIKNKNITIKEMIVNAFPELSDKEDLLDYIWRDLRGMGFNDSTNINNGMTSEQALLPRTTSIAKGFLRFIDESKT